MRINHNIAALNTYRQLTGNVGSTGKSLEKLSSGLRINKAGDDAAGLAISEKMRAQIRGLDQATRNASDAISLIQTAEGALTETHSILQRMRELAVQSATDTNTTTDRGEIQKEINNLLEEVDRISNETQFNGQKLLNGEYNGKVFHIGANQGQKMDAEIANMGADALGEGKITGTKSTDTITVADTEITINAKDAGAAYRGATVKFATDAAGYNKDTNTITVKVTRTGDAFAFAGPQVDGKDVLDTIAGVSFGTEAAADAFAAAIGSGTAVLKDGGTGVNALSVTRDGVTTGGVLTRDDANKAIEVIDAAIQSVSSERAKLGGVQNRLEHTINNLGATSENLAASESRIRDVDMAKEMMEFTKNNILSQASQAMLAQANMQPQSVLQLLQ